VEECKPLPVGVVRDLPVDFTVLMENVVDFDHGAFAHQALPFDLYSGSKQYPQKVQVQEQPLTISMKTAAVGRCRLRR